MTAGKLHRLSAFTDNPSGGNPAGVWIGETHPDVPTMQRIAKEVGFSETAFIEPATGRERHVRYFSPEAEVPFCGHATIASGVQLGNQEGVGEFMLRTAAGKIKVVVSDRDGLSEAALTSVGTRHKAIEANQLSEYLSTFGWSRDQIDLAIPPAVAYAGAWHLVIALKQRETLAQMHYDFDSLKRRMLADDITTIQVVWRECDTLFHARNPFPVGGVVEDPATGAAAAAFGGYLRDAKITAAPHSFQIHQGDDMGQPSRLAVDVPVQGGVRVAGLAVTL